MIRPGRPTDADGVGGLRAAYRAELAAAGRTRSQSADWEAWFARRVNAGDVRVVVEADRVVGYIAWQLRHSDGRQVLVVRELYVAQSERGQRHGGGLLARALDRARATDAVEIEVDVGLNDPPAHALLRSFGFQNVNGRLVRDITST